MVKSTDITLKAIRERSRDTVVQAMGYLRDFELSDEKYESRKALLRRDGPTIDEFLTRHTNLGSEWRENHKKSIEEIGRKYEEWWLERDNSWAATDLTIECRKSFQLDLQLNALLNNPHSSKKDVNDFFLRHVSEDRTAVLIEHDNKITPLPIGYFVWSNDSDSEPEKCPGWMSRLYLTQHQKFPFRGWKLEVGTSELELAQRDKNELIEKGRQAVISLGVLPPKDILRSVHQAYLCSLAYLRVYQFGDATFNVIDSPAPESSLDELVKADIAARKATRGVEDVLSIQHMATKRDENSLHYKTIPLIPGLDDDGSLDFINVLMDLCPPGERNYELMIHPITRLSSSGCVGYINDKIFKVYAEENKAASEVYITGKLASEALLEGRIAKLSLANGDFIDQTKLSSPRAIATNGYLTFDDRYVVLTGVEGIVDEKPEVIDEDIYQTIRSIMSDFDSETKRHFEENPILQRLYTLAILHSRGIDNFNMDDPVCQEHLPRKYHDFHSTELKGEFSSKVIRGYQEASARQSILYMERESGGLTESNSLVFTHGDAKWDNWHETNSLIDFGSAKISTEYKDVANALLDYDGLFFMQQVEDFLSSYHRMRGIFGDDPGETIEQFKANVYDAFVTEAVRHTHYRQMRHLEQGQPAKKWLCDQLKEIAEFYVDKGREVRRILPS
jgi:hypothetical protein